MKRNRQLSILTKLAGLIDYNSWGLLKEVEDLLACEFVVTVMGTKISSEAKRYLAMTTLPYVIGGGMPKFSLDKIWHSRRKVFPTGNLQPEYFVISKFDVAAIKRPAVRFDRCWSYGAHAAMMRQALLKANVLFKCWFTTLGSQSVPRGSSMGPEGFADQYIDLYNEINILKPRVLILVGQGLEHFYELGKEIVAIDHPMNFGSVNAYAGYVKEKIGKYVHHSS